MKRILAFILAVMMISVALVGCGDDKEKKRSSNKETTDPKDVGKIVTYVDMEYSDGFADNYADSCEVDYENGTVKYRFEDEAYERFLEDYHEVVKEEAREKIECEHEYTHFNMHDSSDDKNYGIMVGISEEVYDEYGEEALKAQAKEVGKVAIKYQMNTENPATSIPITYRNVHTAEKYFTYNCTIL